MYLEKSRSKNLSKQKGITLIALVVTIVVLLILAGTAIAMLTGDSGIMTNAQKAKMSTELAGYKEEVELYKAEKYMENIEFEETSLTAGKENLFYNTQESGETGNIKTIIPDISDKYLEKLEIIKGELLINTQDKDEIEVAQSIGIEVNPYNITEDGVLVSSNGNLLLMDETGTLVLPDRVTAIGEGAFANLNGLKTIVIPGTVKKIGNHAFSYNTTLETVIMQEGVEVIGGAAFEQCSNLKNVEFPDSLTQIGTQAFYDCVNLQKVEIPSKVKTMESYVFGNCLQLNEITLPEGLEEIQAQSFMNTSFSKIEIPSTVVSIKGNAFEGNKKLNNIIIKGNSPYIYESGMLMPKEKDEIIFISNSYLQGITKLEIPNGVVNFNTSISPYTNIKELVIPDTVQTIYSSRLPESISNIEIVGNNSKYAVSDEYKILYTKDTKELITCFSKDETINLKNIDEVSILAEYSFKQATNAKTIILPDLVTYIRSFSFSSNLKNLQEIKIGKNVTYISPLFKYENYKGKVTIDSENKTYTIENDIIYSKNKKTLICVLYKITGKFEIVDTVENIGGQAFHNQNGMTEVIIPNTVKTIGQSFWYCSKLTSIEIPSSVESIDLECFSQCPNINKIIVNKGENEITGAPWGATKGMKVVEWRG